MDRYFLRSRAFYLPAGQWQEVNEEQFLEIRNKVKAKNTNYAFYKNNVEGTVVFNGLPPETYQYIDPELFNILLTPNPFEISHEYIS